MRTSLRKCPKCVEYTLLDQCGRCGCTTDMPIPPRYSPEDRYGEYRRRLRKERGDYGKDQDHHP
ncbi:RNA-protein complex protein Nop10 [Methanomassiliicoccus luminyensis]|uniref:RNA-protein complex protein Nop10 n=1 Tax=Methanomassiliicoccus luminyensis TaxID=1080712 RepID=UPI0009D9D730